MQAAAASGRLLCRKLSGRRRQPCGASPSAPPSYTSTMSRELIQRLQRLQRGFSAPCASLADAEALFADIVAFQRAVDSTTLPQGGAEAVRWAKQARGSKSLPVPLPIGRAQATRVLCCWGSDVGRYHLLHASICICTQGFTHSVPLLNSVQGNGGPAAAGWSAGLLAWRS